jgi:GNAT superfamily N-acetyltransferase
MKIRAGSTADIPDMLRLLDEAVAWLVSQGLPGQWGTTAPSSLPATVERVGQYARDYLVRIAEDDQGRTVGYSVLAQELRPHIPAADEPELYLRQLTTDRTAIGSGIGAALIADARELAVERGLGLLRVDCYAGDDRKLVQQYRRLGFTETVAFTQTTPDGAPWPGQILEMRLRRP